MTSDHNRIKIEINDRKTYRKSKNIWKIESHLEINQFIFIQNEIIVEKFFC